MPKVIFFDAAGTLIHLPRSVGEHYREVALSFGMDLQAIALDDAFKRAWKAAPVRPASDSARVDDDKGWWRSLVCDVFRQVLPNEAARRFDFAACFEALYAHFAREGVWQVYEDVRPALDHLLGRGLRLGVISNFDGRLRTIFDGLRLSKYFEALIISSEVGADKPDPRIFQRALSAMAVTAEEAMHVGDDPATDWGAEASGLRVFRLKRPQVGLAALTREVQTAVEVNGLVEAISAKNS